MDKTSAALSKGLSKLPKSAKYDHVTTKIDSGMTIYKVKTVNVKDIIKRRDETFYRVTRNQLQELIMEYEENGSDMLEKPYIIYDVRDDFDYHTCKIQSARNFPAVHARRDYTPNELYDYRNKEEMLIILYCDDEKISCDIANVLIYRGTENIFVLTGGIKSFHEKFPEYVEGNYPLASPKTNLSSIPESGRMMMTSRSHMSSSSTAINNYNNNQSKVRTTPQQQQQQQQQQSQYRLTERNLAQYDQTKNAMMKSSLSSSHSNNNGSISSNRYRNTGNTTSIRNGGGSGENIHSPGRYGNASESNYSTMSVAASVISRAQAAKNKY